MNQTQTVDGARVTLEDIRADEEFVVINFSVQDLKNDRRNRGRPAELSPPLASGPPEALPPHYGRLTDEAGRRFDLVRASMQGLGPEDGPEARRTPKANTAVFAPPGNLEPGSNRRLRFEFSLEQLPIPFASWEEAEGGEPQKPPIGPFVFDFEVPVRRVPVVEVGQEAEANGITLTLERVVNSTTKPQAIVRFDPPSDGRLWVPRFRKDWLPVNEAAAPGQQEGGRWSLGMDEPAKGRSSLTVEYLRGVTPGGSPDGIRVICGPWTFEFEAPDP